MYITFPRLRLRVSLFAIPAALCMLWIEGTLPFFVLMSSALAHELGHLTALRFSKKTPRRIDILPMGALIVVPEGIKNRDEFRIALAGPLASLLLSLIASLVFTCSHSTLALFAALTNLTLGLFNLMPVRKLDGGKALSAFLQSRMSDEKTERLCKIADTLSKLIFLTLAALSTLYNPQNLGILLLSATLLSQLFK